MSVVTSLSALLKYRLIDMLRHKAAVSKKEIRKGSVPSKSDKLLKQLSEEEDSESNSGDSSSSSSSSKVNCLC